MSATRQARDPFAFDRELCPGGLLSKEPHHRRRTGRCGTVRPSNAFRATAFSRLVDFAKNWLAYDGVWFQAVAQAHGMVAAS